MRALDYRAIRRAIPLSRVLELLEFHPSWIRGCRLRGGCMLCGRAGVENLLNQRRSCFAADVDRDLWYCFGCGRGGDQLTLWSLASGQPLYPATKRLCHSAGLPIPWRS